MRQGKWQERAVDGVLLGYHQFPGGRWSGDFIVAELPQLSGGGDVPERPRIFRTADVHTVKGKPWSFPLSEKNLDDEAVLDWQIEDNEDHDGDSDDGGLIANPDDGDHPDDPLQNPERPSQPHAPSKPPSPAPSNATPDAALRGGDAQGNAKVWIRHDTASKALQTTLSMGRLGPRSFGA